MPTAAWQLLLQYEECAILNTQVAVVCCVCFDAMLTKPFQAAHFAKQLFYSRANAGRQ
jgi:hypothetical protein